MAMTPRTAKTSIRVLLAGAAALALLPAGAVAQQHSGQQQGQQTGKNGSEAALSAAGQDEIRNALRKAGFSDVSVIDAAYLVHAKAADGTPVVMMINPPPNIMGSPMGGGQRASMGGSDRASSPGGKMAAMSADGDRSANQRDMQRGSQQASGAKHGDAMKSGSGERAAQSAGDAKTGSGDKLTLTETEAEAWTMRPVVSNDDQIVGHVAAVTLNKNGKISEIRVKPDELLGANLNEFKVKPSDFDAEPGRIVLSMDSLQARQQAAQ